MDRPTDRCETVAEVLELLSGAKGPSWQSFLQDLMDAGGLTYARFAAACGIGRGTLRRWCTQGGAPRSRDTFLRVGLGAAMEPAAVSAMLNKACSERKDCELFL